MIRLSKGETLELLIRSIYALELKLDSIYESEPTRPERRILEAKLLEMNKKKERFFTDWNLRDLTEERI